MPQSREIVFIHFPLITYDFFSQHVFGPDWLIKNAAVSIYASDEIMDRVKVDAGMHV